MKNAINIYKMMCKVPNIPLKQLVFPSILHTFKSKCALVVSASSATIDDWFSVKFRACSLSHRWFLDDDFTTTLAASVDLVSYQ